ncbi:MAG: hypothetical protein NTX71_01755 [Candidatus Aureabacteria bacterium]|nr:hypothetical protein [Candidatus Auribacterota bacterium]
MVWKIISKVRPGRAFGFLIMPHEICEINMKSECRLLFLPLLVLVIMVSGTVWATHQDTLNSPATRGTCVQQAYNLEVNNFGQSAVDMYGIQLLEPLDRTVMSGH